MKSISSILFATNLSKNCTPAFEFAASLATRYQATLVILHVLERMPDYIEAYLRGMLGEEKWQTYTEAHQKNALDNLAGKKSDNRIIREALEKFCAEAGIDDAACGYHSREIVLTDGNVVEDIISQARRHRCDLIIMGAHQGIITGTSVGATVKNVLRGSKLPVLVVPPAPEADAS
jgi:nucleotide-binding universal stress UspA family protein